MRKLTWSSSEDRGESLRTVYRLTRNITWWKNAQVTQCCVISELKEELLSLLLFVSHSKTGVKPKNRTNASLLVQVLRASYLYCPNSQD